MGYTDGKCKACVIPIHLAELYFTSRECFLLHRHSAVAA